MPAPQTLRICLSQRSLTDFYFFFSNHPLTSLPFLSAFAFCSLSLHNWNHICILNYSPLFFFYTTQENIPGKLPASQVTGHPLSKFTYFSHSQLSPCQKLINPRRPPRNSHGELSALSVKRTASALWAPKSLTSTLPSASVAWRGWLLSGFLPPWCSRRVWPKPKEYLGTTPSASFADTLYAGASPFS